MIIDIGGGTTEIAVIALSGIVCDQSIRIAGDEFTSDIMQYMKRQHNILIGERTAEQIKIHVGSALQVLDTPPDDYFVNGRDLMTGIPKQISVSYQEIAHALDKSISKIEEAVIKALETTPPELASDIFRGLYLTGGGGLYWSSGQTYCSKDEVECTCSRRSLKGCSKRNRYCIEKY